MTRVVTPRHKLMEIPESFYQELNDAPEEKQPEIANEKIVEFTSMLASSELADREPSCPMDAYGIDVTAKVNGSAVAGSFFAHSLGDAKTYIDSLKRVADETKMEITISKAYPLTEEQSTQHAHEISNRKFVVDKEKISFTPMPAHLDSKTLVSEYISANTFVVEGPGAFKNGPITAKAVFAAVIEPSFRLKRTCKENVHNILRIWVTTGIHGPSFALCGVKGGNRGQANLTPSEAREMAQALMVAAELSEDLRSEHLQREKEESIKPPSVLQSSSTQTECGEPEISDEDIPF